MPAIKVQNLTKKFKGFTAVNGINFEVEENHVMGFLGPNGAGKTTTIRMLAGLSKPTSGEIEIAGQKINFSNSSSNNVFGYLPEQPSFYNWMSGTEYLNFIADIFNIESEKRLNKIKELLKLVNLEEAKNKRISTYSNGMKQRLGIAQALINDPKVLIMDEPVSALDPIGRREVLNVIENLKKNKTILISTHILSDVDRVCDDVAIINKGKIIALSPLSELKEKYSTQILELEFAADPKDIIHQLMSEPWQQNIEKNGNVLRIWLKDGKAIDQNIPYKFFANINIPILKYGLALPEVEDLFVELIENEK